MGTKKVSLLVAALAVATTPVLASAATSNDSTTINATIGSTISITSGPTVTLNVTPDAGGQSSSASDTVSVSTNNALGYELTFSNSDTTTNLVSGGNTIAAHAGTFAAPTTLANNSWGYRVDSVGSFGAGATSAETNVDTLAQLWAGVPSSASPHTLKDTSSTASGDTTTVWYGVKADTTKPNGTYTDTVTYTATTN